MLDTYHFVHFVVELRMWTFSQQHVCFRTISYSGSISASGDSLLALYGWTTSSLVEYYVIETYGSYNPGSAGILKGTATSDGATYDIYEVVRTDAPSIEGTQTFNQYTSLRTSERTSGTITFQNHITAWANLGLVSSHGLFLLRLLAPTITR